MRIPESWREIPSFSGLRSLKAEVQVRTVAQHMWAAVSHRLQYKQERSVPPPLRRAIHRISALLEIVDSECDRLLEERRTYVEQEIDVLRPDALLNVDVIRAVLDASLPSVNKVEEELYDALLADLTHFGIGTAEQLRTLLDRHIERVMRFDARMVKHVLQASNRGSPGLASRLLGRAGKGAFFSHVALAREALKYEFGVRYVEWKKSRGSIRS